MAVSTSSLDPAVRSARPPVAGPRATVAPPNRRVRGLNKIGSLPLGWPLSVSLLGFPIWWALGFAEFVLILAAVPMLWTLVRLRPIRVPKGFGLWALVLLVMAVSVVALDIQAPGTAGGGSPINYGYTLGWYLAATIVLLYVGNLSESTLSNQRISRLLAWMFVFTAVGGIVGLIAPTFNFTSVAEIVLPRSLTGNAFFSRLTHPAVADLQSVLGFEQARPRAPFAYANSWGANLSLTLPFFLYSWCRRSAGWRRFVAPVILIMAAVGTVYSLNRGLWVALLLGAVYAAIQLVRKYGSLAVPAIIGVGLAMIIAFLVSPLQTIVTERLDNQHSNEIRENLAGSVVDTVMVGSPVIGFGAPRQVQGGYSSIALGPTAACPLCGYAPPLGTQGQVWTVLFSQGILGIVLFLAFFAGQGLQYVRSKKPITIVSLAVLLFFVFEIFVYDTGSHPMFIVFIALALMWRAERSRGNPVAEAAA